MIQNPRDQDRACLESDVSNNGSVHKPQTAGSTSWREGGKGIYVMQMRVW